MSETPLIPYSEFPNNELAAQLHEAVQRSESLLWQRNLVGLISRYGDSLETAREMVAKGSAEHKAGILGHYAIIGESGDVEGAASISPELKLLKQRFPMKAGIPRGIRMLAVRYPFATPNIHAWVKERNHSLDRVYRELVLLGRSDEFQRQTGEAGADAASHMGSPWTVEPERSPKEIHDALIAFTGLERVALRRFDDGENGRQTPPRGVLYAALESVWVTPHGKLKELRTGDRSFFANHLQKNSDTFDGEP